MSRLALMGAGASGAGGAGLGTYPTAVLALSPLLYWRMNDPSGTTVADASGNGRTGTYTGSPTLGATGATTDSDKAVTFNGTSQYASRATPPSTVTDNYAVSLWVKLNSLTSGLMMFARNGDSADGWGIGMGDGAGGSGLLLTGLLGGVAWQPTGFTFADTNFHHVVYTRESGTTKIYIDNVAQSVTQSLTAPLTPANEFTVASELTLPSTHGRFAPATIDDVSVHGALTAANVSTLFNAR